MAAAQVQRLDLVVAGRAARVFTGGDGPALLLVHGGWGGAQLHWRSVWNRFATRHRVVAPDLPGLGDTTSPPLGTVRAYAAWLVSLLDALGIDRVACVGNSFGATVGYALASRASDRCSRCVMVNGFPMPATPDWLAHVGHTRAGHAAMRWLLKRFVYTRRAIPRAFHDLAHVPPELEPTLVYEWPEIVPAYTTVLIAGDGAPPPGTPPALVWGEADRLPGTSLDAARRLRTTLGASALRTIPNAGHFPQIEAPERFVEAVEASIG